MKCLCFAEINISLFLQSDCKISQSELKFPPSIVLAIPEHSLSSESPSEASKESIVTINSCD